MEHAYHSSGALIELLQGLLKYDPLKRLEAQESLRNPFFIEDYRGFGSGVFNI